MKKLICTVFLIISQFVFTQSLEETRNINKTAKKIVKANLEYIKKNYYGYSGGFKSPHNFYSQSSVIKFLNILNQYRELRINVPSKHRTAIYNKGYLNQHQTNKSNGCLCPDNRNAKEAAMINWSKQNYSNLNNYIKPKYGSMGILGKKINAANQYGDDIYILDENKIQGRVTYTLTDSLGISSTYFNNQSPIFIPLEFQELLLKKLMKSNLSNIGDQIYKNYYTEIQIWGVLGLNSLKEFRFSKQAPSEELTSYLLKNNIRIREIICSSSKIGHNTCLKDYKVPSVFQMKTFLAKRKMKQARMKLIELVKSGYDLKSLYLELSKRHKVWMSSITKSLRDLGDQTPESWFQYTDQLIREKRTTHKFNYKQFALFGNIELFITYLFENNISEDKIDLEPIQKPQLV